MGSDAVADYSDVASVASYATTATTATGKPRRTKKKHGKASSKAAEPQKPIFVPATAIPAGLSNLGKTADGLRPAYLRLDISGTDMATAADLAAYRDLQTLVLPHNELQDLSHLQHLHSLTHLDVTGNKLSTVLGFTLPAGVHSNLRVADFTSNQITELRDLSHFARLTHLTLDNNQLTALKGLHGLRMLNTLSLAGNRLRKLSGLEGLTGLKQLNIEGNRVRSLVDISSLVGLEVLKASRNEIESLAPLATLTCLLSLDVSHNSIPALSELSACRQAVLLSELDVRGNPVQRVMALRLHLVHLLPQVVVLNGEEVSAKEKVLAGIMHGSDADALRSIRRKHFPSGELDDGGGAIPPPSAGLVASMAEEEVADSPAVAAAFTRVDAWARSILPPRPPSPLPGSSTSSRPGSRAAPSPLPPTEGPGAGAALVALAAQLASVCKGNQLETARVCFHWVAYHTSPPPGAHLLGSVSAPLFKPESGGAWAEAALLGGTTGTWAERAVALFTQLARACEMEAVMISGYWKGVGTIEPGTSIAAHNHAWAGIKVSGRWRLVDPSVAALHGAGADSPASPFYAPPTAWIYSYFPLEAHWQLLPEPLSLQAWWDLPYLSLSFFSRGLQLLQPQDLAASNTLPPPRQGEVLPSFELLLACPLSDSTRLRHVVRDAQTGAIVARWPDDRSPCVSPTQDLLPVVAYQQVEHTPPALVQFGSRTWASAPHRLVTSLPGPGQYLVEVQFVSDVPGGLPVSLEGLPSPLVLRLVEDEEVLRVKVTVPEVEPHDPSEGILHDPSTNVRVLPTIYPEFVRRRAQLLSPSSTHPLEADRPYNFVVIAPGASRLAIALPSGTVLADLAPHDTTPSRPGTTSGSSTWQPQLSLPRTDGNGWADGQQEEESIPLPPGQVVFKARVVAPRYSHLQLVAYTSLPELGACGWLPLLTFRIAPQSQHIVHLFTDLDVPHVDPSYPAAHQAAELFAAMDMNRDGLVTRKELIAAIRANRQIADILRLPTHISMADGSLDALFDGFLSIDNNKLGTFTFDELCAHMGIQPREEESEGDDESEGSSEYEDEGGEDEEEEGQTA